MYNEEANNSPRLRQQHRRTSRAVQVNKFEPLARDDLKEAEQLLVSEVLFMLRADFCSSGKG